MVEPFYIFGQPSWLWGGNDPSNMYVYNPSNFNVNYSNSSGWATGAGYADSLRSNGSTVNASNLIIHYGTFNRYEFNARNDPDNAWVYCDCAGFVRTEGVRIILYIPNKYGGTTVGGHHPRIWLNINNTGNTSITGNNIGPGYGLFMYSGGVYRDIDSIVGSNCNCDDSRCGDDGF